MKRKEQERNEKQAIISKATVKVKGIYIVTRTGWIILGSLIFFLSLIATPANALEVGKSDWKLNVRGFIATDSDFDQRNMGGSEPLFPPRDGTIDAEDSTFRFSANQTQLGFGFEGPLTDGLFNRAYVEIDFLGGLAGNRPNTPNPRLRHAYWQLEWNKGNDSLLIGQTNVLYGDLLPDITFDNLNLALGSLFGREPQIRYTHIQPLGNRADITFSGSVNAPNSGLFNQLGEIDAPTGSAESSGLPFFHGKIAYHTNALGRADYFGFEKGGDVPLELAFSGFYGREQFQNEVGKADGVNAWGIAASGIIPIRGIRENKRAGSVSVTGQFWFGKNIDSYFGGNGQGVVQTINGKRDSIEGIGFFVTGKVFLTDRIWVTALYGQDDNDLDELVDAGTPFRIVSGLFAGTDFGAPGVDNAQSVNVTVWFQPINPLYIGIGWDYRKVEFNDGGDGDNNRLNISTFFNF